MSAERGTGEQSRREGGPSRPHTASGSPPLPSRTSPGPAPWLTRPSPAALRATPESSDPAQGAQILAAPHSPRQEGEQRAREGGKAAASGASTAHTAAPAARAADQAQRGGGRGEAPAGSPTPRVTRDRPRPACLPPPGVTEGRGCPATHSRCSPHRGQSLVLTSPGRCGVSVPVAVLVPFLSERECHQLGVIPTLNQNTVEIVTMSQSDEFQDNDQQWGTPAGPAGRERG